MHAPVLKGLQNVHDYTCERLESLIFDQQMVEMHVSAAAYLYGMTFLVRYASAQAYLSGQAIAMSSLTAEAVALAIENL